MAVPLCSSDQVCAALRRAGFEPGRKSSGGSHQKWVKQVEERKLVVTVVLGKKEVARGTLRCILEQARLTEGQFAELLHARRVREEPLGINEG